MLKRTEEKMGTKYFEEDHVHPKWPIYTRANIGEVFPDVITPATHHLIWIPGDRGWQDVFRTMGVRHKADAKDDEFLIIGQFGGYGYLNLSYLRMAGARAPGGSAEVIDMSLFGDGNPPAYKAEKYHKRPLNTLKMLKYVAGVLGKDHEPALVEEGRGYLRDIQKAEPSLDASDEDLLAFVHDFPRRWRPQFKTHMLATMTGSVLTGILVDGAMAAERPDLIMKLTAAVGDVETSNISAMMNTAAQIARTEPKVSAEFEKGVEGLGARLANMPEAKAFNDAFAAFIKRYGHRGPNDWELSAKIYENTPELAYAAIDVMRKADGPIAQKRDPLEVEAERDEAARIIAPKLGFIDRRNFMKAVNVNKHWVRGRESARDITINLLLPLRHAYFELARRAADRGGVQNLNDTCLLHPFDEFPKYLKDPKPWVEEINRRAELHARFNAVEPPFFVTSSDERPTLEEMEAATAQITKAETVGVGTTLEGIAGSPGKVRGRARVILDAADPEGLEPGDILVAPMTDPTWTPLFLPAAAVVVNLGALMSHAVVVARELNIPCVVSVEGGTEKIPNGALIEVDGSTGTVTIIEDV